MRAPCPTPSPSTAPRPDALGCRGRGAAGLRRATSLTLGQAVAARAPMPRAYRWASSSPSRSWSARVRSISARASSCSSACSASPCRWYRRPRGYAPWPRASPATRLGSRSTSPASSAIASTTHGRPWPTSRPCTSASTSCGGAPALRAFRPGVPAGQSGWGAKGELDLDAVRAMTWKAGVQAIAGHTAACLA